VAENGVWALYQARNDLRNVSGVMLRIVCRWEHVFTLTMAAEVEEHAPEFVEFAGYRPPNAAMATVAMQAKQRYRTRRRRASRRPERLV